MRAPSHERKRSSCFAFSGPSPSPPWRLAAPIAAVAACGTTAATTTIPPITGIIISSQSLVAGIGCGTGANQVYKYAAIVEFPPDAGVVSGTSQVVAVQNVFSCFSDGQFANLPASSLINVSLPFQIVIFAYNESAYLSQQATIDGDVASPQSTQTTQLTSINAANSLLIPTPTWKTTCTAPVTLNVQSVAVCGPLVPYSVAGDAGVPDGGAADASAPDDSGAADASAPDDSGAVDASFGDAGAMLDAEAGASSSDGGGDAGVGDASDANATD